MCDNDYHTLSQKNLVFSFKIKKKISNKKILYYCYLLSTWKCRDNMIDTLIELKVFFLRDASQLFLTETQSLKRYAGRNQVCICDIFSKIEPSCKSWIKNSK